MSKPELIVPIRDRRRHPRILTLKNFGIAMGVLVAFFIGLTVESNVRHPKADENYGRLFGKQVSSQTAVATPQYDAVKEAPVNDQTAADPLLVDAQRREQWLSVQPVPATTTTVDPQTNTGIVITQTAPQQSQPLLSGGIFRQ
jgi:hypothetical protein